MVTTENQALPRTCTLASLEAAERHRIKLGLPDVIDMVKSDQANYKAGKIPSRRQWSERSRYCSACRKRLLRRPGWWVWLCEKHAEETLSNL